MPNRSTQKPSSPGCAPNTPNKVAAKGYPLRPAAQQDLESIWNYTAHTWSVSQAETYARRLFSGFERPATKPDIARERTEYTPPVRIHRAGQHVIIYHLVGDHVEIIRVRHGREEWMNDPEGTAR